MILVSACLAGMKVRYNKTDKRDARIEQLVQNKQAVMACPELLGGFGTPRLPAEITGGTGEDVLSGKAKVIDQQGNDVTELYVKGAMETLQMAREHGITAVVLKENSPSCGSSAVYDGTFSGTKQIGTGVTTALLRQHGIQVFSENELGKLVD